ncbi:hypothetical protein KC343_g12284 [Hortaea werneckii]|nr:hypothetical protein KC352_g22934 [Hortaea werneckii]KAI7560176.1 hypothetical protein KC317_g9889 [Hortaea werneckii]KAI7608732.1 hypothetical protein KC346_g9487 [Hortaea werneckii]KAI7609512.1 hypothetical protein KC343_g12284 [Hortaea werneckii]KAI7646982.1 hypothetical protein KC319_g11724 [Hortaea werneckii]
MSLLNSIVTTYHDLFSLSADERESHYQSTFKGMEALQDFYAPKLPFQYSQYNAEIQAAYARHKTFVIDVWINYDTSAGKFFTDRRVQDCGKIRLTPDQAVHLRHDGAMQAKFHKIRLEISRPFMKLAILSFAIHDQDTTAAHPTITAGFRDCTNGERKHEFVIQMLRNFCVEVGNGKHNVTNGKDHFDWEDLTRLAANFCLSCPPEEDFARQFHGYEGLWMFDPNSSMIEPDSSVVEPDSSDPGWL